MSFPQYRRSSVKFRIRISKHLGPSFLCSSVNICEEFDAVKSQFSRPKKGQYLQSDHSHLAQSLFGVKSLLVPLCSQQGKKGFFRASFQACNRPLL